MHVLIFNSTKKKRISTSVTECILYGEKTVLFLYTHRESPIYVDRIDNVTCLIRHCVFSPYLWYSYR